MLNIVLCAQRSFGSAVFRMLKEKQGVRIASVFTPEGDGLATLAGMYHIPVLPAGTLRADRLPDGVDLIVAAHSHDFISRAVRNRVLAQRYRGRRSRGDTGLVLCAPRGYRTEPLAAGTFPHGRASPQPRRG